MNVAPRPLVSKGVPQTVSTDEVYQVMTGCASQDPALFQVSSTRLKELLEMFGIYDALHEIAAQKAVVPLQIRQQSIIQFKNAALPHWRSRKNLSEDHRIRIRVRCLMFLDEEDETIAECNEVSVAKISRIDYPNNWPNLVDDLLKIIHSTLQKRFSDPVNEDPRDILILRRSIQLLNHGVLKEFSAIKIPSGMKTMGAILAKCQVTFWDYYSTLVSSLYLKYPYPDFISPRAYTDMLLAHLVYKCITKMAEWLWRHIGTGKNGIDVQASHNWIATLVGESHESLKQLVKRRHEIFKAHETIGLASNPCARRCVDILTRHIRLFGKFFRRLQEISPSRFSTLPCSADLVAYYWGQVVEATIKDPGSIADSNEAVYPVRFLVQGMCLFKDSLSQWKASRKDGGQNENALPPDFVQIAVETLIKQFMPLKDTELNEWMSDPEQWVNDEDTTNEQWVFEIRPCSERVLLSLSSAFPDVVAPLLLNLYNNFGTILAGNLQEIVQKEALYCALGRCAPRLENMLPFEQWLQTTLTAEARSAEPTYPIIKRRIAWLLGKLVSDTCISPANVLLWQIMVHLLRDRGPGSDTVVRLTAAIALRECVDSIYFDINVFAPFLPDVVSELIKLLGEADTFEIKRRVDYTLNVVIEQSGERISDFVNIITDPLPGLWIGAGDNFLFKCSLLVTVMKLVEATKDKSIALTGIVIALVREGMSPEVASRLDEDALNLWLAALRNTTTLQSQSGPALIDLFPQAISLLASNLDLLGKAIDIVVAHFLLDAALILRTFAVDLFRAFVDALSSASVETNLKDMILALNLLVQVAPSSLWGEAMHTSGLFSLLMKNIADGECGLLLLTEHILLMSRIVMADRQMFLQLMSATATASMTEAKLYDKLLDQWWGTWDSMSEPRYRKLSAMGMAALVSTAQPDALERIPGDIFNMWTDVLLELKEAQVAAAAAADEAGENGLSPLDLNRLWELNEAPPAYFQSTEGTLEYDRRKLVYDRDPVRTVQLTAYIATNLNEGQAKCGPQAFQDKYLFKVDPAVLWMIQDQLSRN